MSLFLADFYLVATVTKQNIKCCMQACKHAIAHLDKAFVEGEIVPDWVLPALPVDWIVGEGRHDPGVDLSQRHPPGGRGLDGHRDQRDVGVRGLLGRVRGQAERAAQEVIVNVEHVHLWCHVFFCVSLSKRQNVLTLGTSKQIFYINMSRVKQTHMLSQLQHSCMYFQHFKTNFYWPNYLLHFIAKFEFLIKYR